MVLLLKKFFGNFGTIGTLIFFWYFRPEVENSTKRRALKLIRFMKLLLRCDVVNAKKRAKAINMALCASEGKNACACGS